MTNQEIQNIIESWSNNISFSEEESEYLDVIIPKDELIDISIKLKNHQELQFDYLFCVTGIDWGEDLGVIYHLESINKKHAIVLKVKTSDRENPQIDSVNEIWRTAEFHEMEIFDFFGIVFNNHPNLKRLFLPPEWEGFPLRKDYVDEENMIVK